MNRSPRIMALIGALAAGVIGCDEPTGDTNRAAAITTRDSAGIEIVEMPGTLLDDLPQWTLSETPILSIGEVEGDAPYLFSHVPSVRRLSDGRIVVIDAQSQEVRLFAGDGTFERLVGRSGEGPGEFTSPTMVGLLPDDGFLVWDDRAYRITEFDRSGDLVGTRRWDQAGCAARPPPASPEMPVPYACTPTESMRDRTIAVVQGSRFRTVGLDWDRWFWAFPDSGPAVVVDSITEPAAQGSTTYMWAGEERLAYGSPVFTARPLHAIGRSGFATAHPNRYEIRRYDHRGSFAQILRVERAAEVATEEHFQRYMDPMGPELGPTGSAMQAVYDAWGLADSIPHFSRLALDDVGRLWVQDPRFTYSGAIDWTVFDEAGKPIARLLTPRRWDAGVPGSPRLHQIGEDFVLGVESDDLGVQRVMVFGLNGPAGRR